MFLQGKRALVTGSTSGIGLAIARALRAEGAEVILNGFGDAGEIAALCTELGASHSPANLLEATEIESMMAKAGPVDILVNNAGTGRPDEYSEDGFRAVIDVNLNAVMALCLALHPVLKERGGAIVNMGSLSSFLALRETPAYTASKAGLLGLTRALADKWAPDGIRVNMVAPGFIRTRMTEIQRTDPDYEKRLLKAVPMQRWGEPEEVAEVVLFLASRRAPYITGQSIAIDGGLMLR